MSHEYALPSSLGLEIEARRMHATPRPAGLGDLAPGVVLAAFPAAFDAAVCALACLFVFPRLVFPELSPAAAVAAALAVCSLAYAAGPAGGWLFRQIDRRHGRGVRLTAARVLLGACTAAIAFLPVEAANVLSVAFLAACRAGQGVGLGGVRAEAQALAKLRLSRNGRAAVAGLRAVAVLLGLVMALGIFAALAGGLATADFLAWGWRYPFIMGVVANTAALFADLRLLATDSRPEAGGRTAIRLATVSGASVDG